MIFGSPWHMLARVAIWVAMPAMLFAVSPRFQSAAQARVEKDYIVVLFANGSRTMVPLRDLGDDDREFLTQLAEEHPLAHGKSKVTVAKSTAPLKKTLLVSKTE